MKKKIIFLLVLTFGLTTEGAERKQGAELILQKFCEKFCSEDKKNDEPDKVLDKKLYKDLDIALAKALEKTFEKAIEKAPVVALGKTPVKASDINPQKIPQKTPEKDPKKTSEKDTVETFDKAIDKSLSKALIKSLDEALEKSLDKATDKSAVDGKLPISVWVGYGYYAMNEFNRKLSVESNETIDGGLNVGIELMMKGAKVAGFEFSSLPIGVEYLDARSETTHIAGATRITVDWELPVAGVYFWPEVKIDQLPEAWKDREDWDLRLRPLGVGYYTLGKVIDAELDVSDSQGYLEVEDETIGVMSQIGIGYVSEDETFEAYVDSGYRWLRFTSVMRKPKGGFAGGSPTAMPEDLDYSGFIIKGGLCMRF